MAWFRQPYLLNAIIFAGNPPPSEIADEVSMRVFRIMKHVTFNHGVEGSSPSALTNKIKHLSPNLKFNKTTGQRAGQQSEKLGFLHVAKPRWNARYRGPFNF